MMPETRFRNHLQYSVSDSSFSEFNNLGQNSMEFLSSRGIRTNKHFNDSRTSSPLPPSAFLKSVNESSYLSIIAKVSAKYSAEKYGWIVCFGLGTFSMPLPKETFKILCLSHYYMSEVLV